MSFHDIRFPTNLSFGALGGPERRTEIITLANGYEERNSPWEHSRRRYNAGLALSSADDIEVVLGFFEARHGQLYAFRWKDWADYRSAPQSQPLSPFDQNFATGDGETTQFQLCKIYTSGEQRYCRPITKPVARTAEIAIDNEQQVDGRDYTIDTTTGLITFTRAPDNGVAIYAGFEFDVPVRFDTDTIQTSLTAFHAGSVPDVPVIEVRIP